MRAVKRGFLDDDDLDVNRFMHGVGAVLATALFGCGGGLSADLPTGTVEPEDLVATISNGEEVELTDHTVAGQWTLFEFTAPF